MLFNFTLSTLSPILSISSDVLSMQFNGSSVWATRASNQSASNYTATLDGESFSLRNGTRLADVGATLFNVTAPESNLLIPPAHDFTFEPAELVQEVSWQSNLNSDLKAYLGPNYCWTQFWKYGFTPRGQWVNGDCLSSDMQAPDCYTTSEVGAYLELKFKGDGVTLYGTLENAGSGYSVSLDGAPFVSYSAGNITSPTNLALAHWNNIGNADHVLIVKNNPDSANPGRLQFTGYDLYVIESEFTNIVINDPAQKYNKNNFAGGAAIGGGIGGVLLIATLWLVRKRIIRKRREATARTAANPRMAGILGRDLEAAKATFVTDWLNRPGENTNTDRDSTTTSSRPGSVHEKDAEKQAGLKPSEYGEPIPPAFAVQLKNISQAEKELKAAEEGTSPSKEPSSRSWNPFKWGKKDQS